MLKKLKSLKDRFRYDDSEMPFIEHLEEFRKTTIRCVAVLLAGVVVCLPFADHLITVLRAPAEPYIEKPQGKGLSDSTVQLRIPADALRSNAGQGNDGEAYYEIDARVVDVQVKPRRAGTIRLQFSEPSAAIKMWLRVSFFGGLLLSLPALVFFIGSFIMPGVRDTERRVMSRVAVFSAALFLLGVIMGYRITLPLALDLMLRVGGRLGGESIWFYNRYIAFAIQLLLGFGIAFQLPVAILIMGKMGLVSSGQLREKRRHVVVGILVLAMILTPPDVLTQLLMAAPLILLYEFCIWFLHFSGNREAVTAQTEPEIRDDRDKN